MTLEEARAKLKTLQEKMAAYGHALGLLYYDGATTAPKATAANRGQTMGVLSEELYQLTTGEETVALLEFLDAHRTELDEREQRMVFLLLKDIRRMQKIPMDEYIAHQRLIVEAEDAWHTAKETSDFPLFEPYLERIFADTRKFAGYCAPDTDPYDYWLNEYEEGLSKARLDEFFGTLRAHIVPLLQKVCSAPQLDNSMVKGFFSVERQDRLSRRLMEVMGLDPTHVGLSTTEHPFTTSLGSHLDERITTHYHEDDFSSSLFSVIHEGGHALYDTGSDDSLAYTVLDGGVSMGIHESQSRFYENLLGRSRAFCDYLFPVLCEVFPDEMAGHSAEELYRALNRSEPSLIRTEADELTYCLHVLVRYELEKRVMAGELAVHDLPAEWNRLYREYLGVDVPDDRRGLLQDSHWSGGSIGYFPSYALGSAYGAQFLRKMKETVDVDGCLRRGDFGPINDWNRAHIWQYGCLYRPGELFEKATGETFDPTVYTTYLEQKFSDLYSL
ncbi:MAG: carboxypeptidase M32 [Ruminococcaceae bacterium]|jgi:carboxypeptidase Taq|nr:carboxypeptidase M32 [Oscillospiraceae bacterium]